MKLSIAAAALNLVAITYSRCEAQTVATSPSEPVPAECQLSQPARIVRSLRELPAVAAEFRRQKIDIADVGEKFIPFDQVDASSQGLPHRQFLRAYIFKDRSLVWYYRGGFVTSFHVVEFRLQRGTSRDDPMVLRLTPRKLAGPPCEATEAMLAGVTGQTGW